MAISLRWRTHSARTQILEVQVSGRESNQKELIQFESSRYKYKYREKQLKAEIGENEANMMKKKNQYDQCKDLFHFYKTPEKEKRLYKLLDN